MRKAYPGSTTLLSSLDLNPAPYPKPHPWNPSALAVGLTP